MYDTRENFIVSKLHKSNYKYIVVFYGAAHRKNIMSKLKQHNKSCDLVSN